MSAWLLRRHAQQRWSVIELLTLCLTLLYLLSNSVISCFFHSTSFPLRAEKLSSLSVPISLHPITILANAVWHSWPKFWPDPILTNQIGCVGIWLGLDLIIAPWCDTWATDCMPAHSPMGPYVKVDTAYGFNAFRSAGRGQACQVDLIIIFWTTIALESMSTKRCYCRVITLWAYYVVGFRVQLTPKWHYCSCYKSLEMHKNAPKTNEMPEIQDPPSFFGL